MRQSPPGPDNATEIAQLRAQLKTIRDTVGSGSGERRDQIRDLARRGAAISDLRSPEGQRFLRDSRVLEIRLLNDEMRKTSDRTARARLLEEIRSIDAELSSASPISTSGQQPVQDQAVNSSPAPADTQSTGGQHRSPASPGILDGNTPGDGLHPQIAKLAEEIAKRGGPVIINSIGDVGSKNSYGGSSGSMPQGPAHVPTPPHGSEKPHGHDAAHTKHEAMPQAKEAMHGEYWRINGLEDIAISEANKAFAALEAATNENDRVQKLAAYKTARTKREALAQQRRAIADQILAPYGGREAAMRQMAREENQPHAGTERAPNAPTATEVQNALGAIRGRTKAEAARIVAVKSGGSEKWTRRFLSALVRWPSALVSGMATGAVGYSFAQTGLASGIASLATSLGVPASWLTAGALGSIPATIGGVAVPFVGGMMLPAVPVVAAALAGMAVWQLGPRKWLGFKKLDDWMDKGWQAKKLYKKMRVGDSQAILDAKYAKISSRPTWRRMQTIPRIFGALLGGMTMHDLVTLSKGGSVQDLVLRKKGLEAYELGKRGVIGAGNWITEFWNNFKMPEWFKSGGVVEQGTVVECKEAVTRLKLLEGERDSFVGLYKDDTELINRLNNRIAALEEQLAKTKEISPQLPPVTPPSAPTIETHTPPSESPPVEKAPARPPVSEPTPASPPIEPPTGLRVKPEQLSFVINEGSDIRSVPPGLRRLLDSMQFKGRAAEWLIDTIDKTTYNGIGVRDGRGVMQLLTDRPFDPRRVPDDTIVNLKNYFSNNAVMNYVQAQIDNSRVLTYAEKLQVRQIVELLEQVARRGN